MTIELKELPTFKRYGGSDCRVCGKRIEVTIRYDKRASDGVVEWSYNAGKCDCGVAVFYRNGRWSWIPKERFDFRRLLIDDLKQSGISVNESGFKKNPLPSI
jgi:hypothetical protein